jgi:hypothetical protein
LGRITGECRVLAEATLHVDREQRLLCLLGRVHGYLVEPPCLSRLDQIGVQPRGQTGDLRYGRRQADALLPARAPGHVAGQGQVSTDRLCQAARRCALLQLAVAERGSHEQLLVAQVRVRDRRGCQDAE